MSPAMRSGVVKWIFIACILQMAAVLTFSLLYLSRHHRTDQLMVPDFGIKVSEPPPNVARARIPKILHQMFESVFAFEDYRQMIDTCLRLNPDWTYYLWTEADVVALMGEHYPQLLNRTRAMSVWLERGDTSRYALLHKFGGVYLDMDVDCRKPIFPLLANYSAFVAQEVPTQTGILYNEQYRAANGIMGTVPGHPFFKLMIEKIVSIKSNARTSEDVTGQVGPKLLTLTLQEYWSSPVNAEHPIEMLPSYRFIPTMDGMRPWKLYCENYRWLSAAEEKLKRNLTLSPNESGCLLMKQRDWSLVSDVQPRTVGIHRWIHLANRLDHQRSLKRFDMSKQFASRINFYAKKAWDGTGSAV